MGIRTVRLDEDTERELAELRKVTGLSISEILKRGVLAYRESALEQTHGKIPYEIYRRLDLGEGGYARAPGVKAKSAVAEVIRRKHRR